MYILPHCYPAAAAAAAAFFLPQSKLLNASEGLLQQSQGMTRLMEVLLHYQHSGASLLHSMHFSTTLQDIAFYAACLSVPLLFFTHPPDARLLLLLSVLVAWVAEKAALQHIVPLHHAFVGAAGVGGPAGGPGYFHAVKLSVRLAVLGGGVGLVLWMLLKRYAAQQRKEQLFQELKRSVSVRAQRAAMAWQECAVSSVLKASAQCDVQPCQLNAQVLRLQRSNTLVHELVCWHRCSHGMLCYCKMLPAKCAEHLLLLPVVFICSMMPLQQPVQQASRASMQPTKQLQTHPPTTSTQCSLHQLSLQQQQPANQARGPKAQQLQHQAACRWQQHPPHQPCSCQHTPSMYNSNSNRVHGCRTYCITTILPRQQHQHQQYYQPTTQQQQHLGCCPIACCSMAPAKHSMLLAQPCHWLGSCYYYKEQHQLTSMGLHRKALHKQHPLKGLLKWSVKMQQTVNSHSSSSQHGGRLQGERLLLQEPALLQPGAIQKQQLVAREGGQQQQQRRRQQLKRQSVLMKKRKKVSDQRACTGLHSIDARQAACFLHAYWLGCAHVVCVVSQAVSRTNHVHVDHVVSARPARQQYLALSLSPLCWRCRCCLFCRQKAAAAQKIRALAQGVAACTSKAL
jgi:hypothetical protein